MNTETKNNPSSIIVQIQKFCKTKSDEDNAYDLANTFMDILLNCAANDKQAMAVSEQILEFLDREIERRTGIIS